MAKKIISLLIASFVFANFIADNILVNAAVAEKGTKAKRNQNVTETGYKRSSKSANLTTEEEIVAIQKLIDEIKDIKASENTENNKTVTNRDGEGNGVGVSENNEDADPEETNSKRQKNKGGRRRRRNKQRTQQKTEYEEVNSAENLQERESSNVGEDAAAELIDTPISQETDESEVAATSEKSNNSSDNRQIGNRRRQNGNQENRDTARRRGGNGERQRGRNGNGRRRGGAGAKRSDANRDAKSRIARRPSGRAGANGTPNKFNLNGFRLPKNNGGKAANRIARNSRNGRNKLL